MCTCDRALELINEKIDQCITQENESVLRSHLSECDECRGIYEAYSLIQQDLLALEEEPPENFAGQVMFRVKAEQQKKKRKIPFGIIGTAACAAALALVIGFTDVGSFLVPKMESKAMANGSTAMNDSTVMERVSDYSTADTATGAEAPMQASDDAAEPDVYADGWVEDAVEESEQLDVDMGEIVYPELTSYAIVLVYDSFDAIGSYADDLWFDERPEGSFCLIDISLAQEIYDAFPNALRYEINEKAMQAAVEAIILIQE